jgi:uncharacterized protein YjbI with pentapeptide repeats
MKIILAPFRFILWILWDFFGVRFFWEKIRPPIETSPGKRPPSTFFLWVLGILFAYSIWFSIVSQRFENRIRLIEERANTILLQLSISDSNIRKTALSRVSNVQNMLYPYKPDIFNPFSIFHSAFGPSSNKHYTTIQVLREALETWKGQLDSVNLEKADLRYAKLNGAKLSKANLKGVNLTGADLMNADLRGADLSGANLTNAVLRGSDFSETLIKAANLQGADLRVPDNIEVWKGTLFGRDPEWIKKSGADLLCTAKTLYGAKLDPELEQQLMTDCPQILEKPQ